MIRLLNRPQHSIFKHIRRQGPHPTFGLDTHLKFVEVRVYLFSNSKDNVKYPNVASDNPFEILGVPKAASYAEVKRRFVELALQHHPDVSEDGDSSEFVRFREAFERIRQDSDGSSRLARAGDGHWTDDEFQAWFYAETSHQDILFRMGLSTRKEVIEVASTLSQGGLDRGGTWEMARAMARQEEELSRKKGGQSASIGIEAQGKTRNSLSRRRRRG